MGDMTRKHIEAEEASLQRALDEPMPRDLNEVIQNLIEPHTINMSLKHGDVMDCIDVAWPVIRDYIQQGPGSLPAIIDYEDEDDEEDDEEAP